MAINRDLSHLRDNDEPDSGSALAELVMDTWFATEPKLGPRPMAVEGARYRASWADQCLRSLQYSMAGEQESNPPSRADLWRMTLGSIVHDRIEHFADELIERMTAEFGDGYTVEMEVPVDLAVLGIPGAATVDMVIYHHGVPVRVVEFKTVGGFAYKLAVANFKGPPQGPKRSHVIQPGLAAASLSEQHPEKKPVKVTVIYMAVEVLSPQLAKAVANPDVTRAFAQWTYGPEEYGPLVEAELEMIHLADRPVYQPVTRLVPIGEHWYDGRRSIVVNPETGAHKVVEGDKVVDAGNTWQCGYCRYKQRCIDDGEGLA